MLNSQKEAGSLPLDWADGGAGFPFLNSEF
jgi:hypothetical protein